MSHEELEPQGLDFSGEGGGMTEDEKKKRISRMKSGTISLTNTQTEMEEAKRAL